MANEVIFIYLGARLPSYAVASLELVRRNSGLEVCLIAEGRAINSLRHKGLNVFPIEDFYDVSDFEQVRSAVQYPHHFRDGFWLKTLERLFVLEQFWRAHPRDDVFHAELDQLLFRCDRLLDSLRSSGGPAVYLPFHTSEVAVASVLYCNSQAGLGSLIDFARSTVSLTSEMALLARWAGKNPTLVSALPTLSDVVVHGRREFTNNFVLPPPELEGIVDAAQLGQWVGGVDPRNVAITEQPRNKFVDPLHPQILSESVLRDMRLSFSGESGDLSCGVGGGELRPLYNLHLHSKIHPYLLRSDPTLAGLVEQSNGSARIAFPGTRSVQVKYHVSTELASGHRDPSRLLRIIVALVPLGLRRPLRPVLKAASGFWSSLRRLAAPRSLVRALYSLLRLRPSSQPFLSGDGFRSIADHVFEANGSRVKPAVVSDHSTVFCETTELESFLERMRMDKPRGVTLLAGNSDLGFDEAMAKGCKSAGVKTVFAQNLEGRFSGVRPLPLGLENKWRLRNGYPRDFLRARGKIGGKLFRVAWSFDTETNPAVRRPARSVLEIAEVADHIGLVSPRAHRNALAKYAFVACPPGNGIDTHRAWEALYLKCVPILLGSASSSYFKEMGLPVLVVEDYSEVLTFTEENLKDMYHELSAGFSSERIWMPYWVRKIRDSSRFESGTRQ